MKMTFKDLIKSKNITQVELSKKIGVTQSAISQWCTNATAPRARDVSNIANVLEVSVKEIIDCFEKEK